MSGVLASLAASGNDVSWIGITVNNAGSTTSYAVGSSAAGDVYVGLGDNFPALVKYTPYGAVSWRYAFNPTGRLNKLVVDSSGNVYVGGSVQIGSFTTEALLLKVDPTGAILWQKQLTYPAYPDAAVVDIAIDASDNPHVVVQTVSSGGSNVYNFLVKFDSIGGTVWQSQPVLSTTTGGLEGIAIDSSGAVYFSGRGASGAQVLMKLTSGGAPVWGLSSAANTIYSALTTDSADNLLVCGYTYVPSFGTLAATTYKFDPSGAVLWGSALGEVTTDQFSADSISCDVFDNVYTTFIRNTAGGIMLAKYDSSGVLAWQRALNLSGGSTPFPSGISTDNIGAIDIAMGSGVSVGLKLPSDGTRAGTYTVGSPPAPASGVVTYAAATNTEVAAPYGLSSYTPTFSGITITISPGTVSLVSGSFTTNVTTV